MIKIKEWPSWLKIVNLICLIFIIIGIGFTIYEFSYCAITNSCDWGPFASMMFFLPVTGIFIAISLFGVFMNYLLRKNIYLGRFISVLFLIVSLFLVFRFIFFDTFLRYDQWPTIEQTIGRYGFYGSFMAFLIPLFILGYILFLTSLFYKQKPSREETPKLKSIWTYMQFSSLIGFFIPWLYFVLRRECINPPYGISGCPIWSAMMKGNNIFVSLIGLITGILIGGIIGFIIDKTRE